MTTAWRTAGDPFQRVAHLDAAVGTSHAACHPPFSGFGGNASIFRCEDLGSAAEEYSWLFPFLPTAIQSDADKDRSSLYSLM